MSCLSYYSKCGSRVATLLLALIVSSAGASAQSPDLVAFDKYVAHAARDWHVPGLAIAIVKDDSLEIGRAHV